MSFSIRILCVAKPANLHSEAQAHYERLLKPLAKVTCEMIPPCASASADVQTIRTDEGKRLLARFEKNGYHAALSEEGKPFAGSRAFSQWVTRRREESRPLCLIIGGAYGLAGEVKTACNGTVTLSPLTMPHELCRIVLLEQLYRAFTILNGHPYHK